MPRVFFFILISVSVEFDSSEDNNVHNNFIHLTIYHLQNLFWTAFRTTRGLKAESRASAFLTTDAHRAVRTNPKLFQTEIRSIPPPPQLEPYHSQFSASTQLLIYIFPPTSSPVFSNSAPGITLPVVLHI